MLNLIDTRHGTDNRYLYSNGNTLPYTGAPMAMNYFVVQSDSASGSFFFNPNHKSFEGYRLTHQPSPWMGDFSRLLFLPVTDVKSTDEIVFFQTSYRPTESTFNPHMMKHKLQRYQIETTLSANTYSMMSENIQVEGENVNYIMHAEGLSLEKAGKDYIQFKVVNYADVQDKDFTMYVHATFDHEIEVEEKEDLFFIHGTSSKSILRMATSFISYDQAKHNLETEQEENMDDYIHKVAKKWNHYLAKIDVNDRDFDKVKLFYQNLYRTFLFPQKFYEVTPEGKNVYYNTYAKKVQEGVMYTNNGFWDTAKTVYPLYSLIAKEEYEEILEGFINSYHDSGYLPKWLSPDERGLMPGTLIDEMIADAATKDIGMDLMPEYLGAMVDTANKDADDTRFGRHSATLYRELGYVPNEISENVNQSLDNTYSDFCIAKVAEKLGQTEIYEEFIGYAKNYQNLFHPEHEFMIGKDRDGNWTENFHPLNWGGDYTEGSVWQNGFAVFHDVEGFKRLFKDEDGLTKKLIQSANSLPNFKINTYAHEIHEMTEVANVDFGQIGISNQPSFHIPYMFSFTDNPEHGELLLKNIMQELFKLGYEGYPGDEDNGSMSAWFIFSSMGFYPFSSATKEYTLGISMYDSIKVHTSYGTTLNLKTNNNHAHFNFVQNVKVNGEVIERNYLTHDELIEGANVEFTLGLLPVDKKDNEKPFSLTK